MISDLVCYENYIHFKKVEILENPEKNFHFYLQQPVAPGWQIKHDVSESFVQMTKFLKTLFPSGFFQEQETFVAVGGGGLTTKILKTMKIDLI